MKKKYLNSWRPIWQRWRLSRKLFYLYRNEQERLRCRYIDVIEDEEGNRKRLTWRDVALRVYRKDDENAIRATTRLHKRALESVKRWVSDQ